ncbi:MAG: hypothetical protein P8K80_00500 [Phycisphaerales bacterium]|nr:hypothetical protein [Phycisphaerales bacterium]
MIRTSILLALVASTTAMGDPNAAEAYRKLLAEFEAIPMQQRHALMDMPPYLEPCDTTLQVRIRSIEDRLHRAAQSKVSDFELDFSQGPELLMPHLSPMRVITLHMAAEARRQTLAGNEPAAARLLNTINRMALHLTQDRLLISSLVGIWMIRSSIEATDFMIEQGQLAPRDASMLLSGFKDLDDRDPMGLLDALDHERQYVGDWIRAQLAEDMGEMKALQKLGLAVDNAEELDTVFDMDGYDRAMRDTLDAMGMDDLDAATTQLNSIEERLYAGDYGPLASMLSVSFHNMLVMRFTLEAELAWLRAGLQRIAAGEEVEDVEPNAAWTYIKLARAIDAAAQVDTVDEAARTALLDELMLAALMEHCEFPIDEFAPRPVVPVWTTGLHRGGRWLVEDARRRFEGADIEGAASRIMTVLGLAADLSATTHLVDSAIAQDMTTDAMALVEELDELELLDPDMRRALLVALREIPAGDPFGYEQSARDSRRLLASYLQKIACKVPDSMPGDADGTAYLLVFHELFAYLGYPPIHCWPLEIDFDALEGIVDATMVQETRQHGLDMMEAAKLDVWIPMEPAPGIVTPSIADRRIAAASLLKQWKRRLGN